MVNNNWSTDEVYIVARFGCERDLARKAPVDIERPLPDDTAHTCTESRCEMRLLLPTPSNRASTERATTPVRHHISRRWCMTEAEDIAGFIAALHHRRP